MKSYAWLLALLLTTGNARAEVFQYIYIEANEGSSSGGHVAVQFGADVFHYQYENGLIRLYKQNADDFRFDYRFLQNRTLHIADIDVPATAYRRLYEHFQLRFFEQERQAKLLRTARQDRLLSEWLLRRLTAENAVLIGFPDAALQLKGAGLFFSDSDFAPVQKPQGECRTATAAAIALPRWRQRLETQYGADFLQRRTAELTDAIHRLSPTPPQAEKPETAYGFAEHYTDLLTALLALRAVDEARPLTADACIAFDAAEGRLTTGERQTLQALQQRLLDNATALAVSKRPDWGYALVVTLARLIAIEQSLQSGRWILPDDFKQHSETISPEQFAHYAKEMQQQRDDALAELRAARKAGALNERSYSRIEMAANRYHAWLQGDKHQAVRYRGEQPLPVKSIRVPDLAFPELSVQQLRNTLQQQENYAQQLTEQLKRRYAYDLLTRNCVTEIFRTIDEALEQETLAAHQRLAGRIDARFYFIPFAAFAKVQQAYPVLNSAELPAYRKQQLAEQYAREFDAWVYARESNILTATLYNPNPDDTWFVFFTDDALMLRPLFGAFNTAAAIVQSAFGVLRWPFDGGTELQSGARGLLMSLPELAFVNMRKGSYRYLSRRQTIPQQ